MSQEPILVSREPSDEQKRLLEARADLAGKYQTAKDSGADDAELQPLRDEVGEIDSVLRELACAAHSQRWIRPRSRP